MKWLLNYGIWSAWSNVPSSLECAENTKAIFFTALLKLFSTWSKLSVCMVLFHLTVLLMIKEVARISLLGLIPINKFLSLKINKNVFSGALIMLFILFFVHVFPLFPLLVYKPHKDRTYISVTFVSPRALNRVPWHRKQSVNYTDWTVRKQKGT